MFGCLRLGLAVLVFLSHVGLRIFGLNIGVIAVVLFFILSGYATNRLFESTGADWRTYYLERTFRIFPAYLLTLALAVLEMQVIPIDSFFLSKPIGPLDLIANLIVLPLNFFQWTGQDRYTLIPPAWSLALELQYYIVVPLVAARTSSVLGLIILSSFIVWSAAALQIIDCDTWGYRMLPGTLFVFLLGLCLAKRNYIFLHIALGLMLLSLMMMLTKLVKTANFNLEEVVGVLIGIPAIWILSRFKSGPVDRFLGSLSYPFFLLHFSVIYLLEAAHPTIGETLRPVEIAICLFATLSLSGILHHLIEKPFQARRFALKKA